MYAPGIRGCGSTEDHAPTRARFVYRVTAETLRGVVKPSPHQVTLRDGNSRKTEPVVDGLPLKGVCVITGIKRALISVRLLDPWACVMTLGLRPNTPPKQHQPRKHTTARGWHDHPGFGVGLKKRGPGRRAPERKRGSGARSPGKVAATGTVFAAWFKITTLSFYLTRTR
jgi:hypothetical protein